MTAQQVIDACDQRLDEINNQISDIQFRRDRINGELKQLTEELKLRLGDRYKVKEERRDAMKHLEDAE